MAGKKKKTSKSPKPKKAPSPAKSKNKRKQESSEDESESSEEVFVTPSKTTRTKPLFGNLLTADDMKELPAFSPVKKAKKSPDGKSVEINENLKTWKVSASSHLLNFEGETVESKDETVAVAIAKSAFDFKIGSISYFEVEILELDSSKGASLIVGLVPLEYPSGSPIGVKPYSCGFNSTGEKICGSGTLGGKFVSYGESFKTGDIIGCGAIHHTGEIFFTKNGNYQGGAIVIDAKSPFPLFPAVSFSGSHKVKLIWKDVDPLKPTTPRVARTKSRDLASPQKLEKASEVYRFQLHEKQFKVLTKRNFYDFPPQKGDIDLVKIDHMMRINPADSIRHEALNVSHVGKNGLFAGNMPVPQRFTGVDIQLFRGIGICTVTQEFVNIRDESLQNLVYYAPLCPSFFDSSKKPYFPEARHLLKFEVKVLNEGALSVPQVTYSGNVTVASEKDREDEKKKIAKNVAFSSVYINGNRYPLLTAFVGSVAAYQMVQITVSFYFLTNDIRVKTRKQAVSPTKKSQVSFDSTPTKADTLVDGHHQRFSVPLAYLTPFYPTFFFQEVYDPSLKANSPIFEGVSITVAAETNEILKKIVPSSFQKNLVLEWPKNQNKVKASLRVKEPFDDISFDIFTEKAKEGRKVAVAMERDPETNTCAYFMHYEPDLNPSSTQGVTQDYLFLIEDRKKTPIPSYAHDALQELLKGIPEDARLQVSLFGGEKFDACFETAQKVAPEIVNQASEFIKNRGSVQSVGLISESSNFSQQSQTSQAPFADIIQAIKFSMPTLEEEFSPNSYYVNIFVSVFGDFKDFDRWEELVSVLRDAPAYVRVFAIGFGTSVSVPMLRVLSGAGRGLYEHVAPVQETPAYSPQIQHLLKCSKLPSEIDVSVEFPGDLQCSVPAYVPAIFAGHTQVFMGLTIASSNYDSVVIHSNGNHSKFKVERSKKGTTFHQFVALNELLQVEKGESPKLFHRFTGQLSVSVEEKEEYVDQWAEKYQLICPQTVWVAEESHKLGKSKKKNKGLPIIIGEYLDIEKSVNFPQHQHHQQQEPQQIDEEKPAVVAVAESVQLQPQSDVKESKMEED